MEMTDEEFEALKQLAREKLALAEKAGERLRQEFSGLTKDEMRWRLELETDNSLRCICYQIAAPAEFYEMCEVAKEVLEARGQQMYDMHGAWLETLRARI